MFSETCIGAACSNEGEFCINQVCKCGVYGQPSCEALPSGEYCDATNSVCKCSETVDSCATGTTCVGGKCGK